MPDTLTIRPWPDPLIDTLGHDPRSRYVETFWLPTLGPTALLLLRHLADRFDRSPDGVELSVADTSQALGVGQRNGSSSPIVRTLARLGQFELACDDGRGTVAVRRNIPPVNRRHLRRLPDDLQSAHADWAEAQLGSRSRCSSRATTPITSSASSTRWASIPRSATTARVGPTNAIARRSSTPSPAAARAPEGHTSHGRLSPRAGRNGWRAPRGAPPGDPVAVCPTAARLA